MENNNYKKKNPILLLIIIFISCQSKTPPVNISIDPTPESSTSTITPRPTTTRGPTRTPAPTRTATLQPTTTITPNPTWVSMVSTETYFRDQIRATEHSIKELNPMLNDCYSVLMSSNNKMFSCRTVTGEMVIYNGINQVSTISQNSIYPDTNDEVIVMPFRWSKDNTTLYITATTCCKDGPASLGGAFYNGLWALNTQKDSITTIIKNEDAFASPYYFSISPTERRLIYINQFENPITVNIVDFKENKTTRVKIEDKFEGAEGVLWSEDGTKIIFVALSGDYFAFTPEARTSLIWLDVITLELKEVVVDSSYMLSPVLWGSDNIITIRSETGIDYVPTDGTYWYYDLYSNQLFTKKPQ